MGRITDGGKEWQTIVINKINIFIHNNIMRGQRTTKNHTFRIELCFWGNDLTFLLILQISQT